MKKFIFAVIALSLAFTIPSHAVLRLKVADNQAETYPTVKTLKFFAEELKKESNGEITLKVFHSGQLGQEKDVIELLKTGAVPMARLSTGNLNGIVPETQVLNLPYIFRDRDHMYKVLQGDIGKRILKSFESYGFIGLTFLDAGARSIYNTKRAIKTPEDLKGLKVRVMGTDLAIAMLEQLGASATPMNFGDVYGSLQTSVIDGAENNPPSFYNEKHFEVSKHFSRTEHMMLPEVIVISKKSWDSLTADQKIIMQKVADKATNYMKEEWTTFEAAAVQKAIKSGVQFNDVDKKAFREKAIKIYPRFVKGKNLNDLISDIQKVQ